MKGKVGDTLHTQLIPNGAQILAFVELDLVGDAARAELFIGRILQVPSRLALLHKLPNHSSLSVLACIVVDGAPDFEVFGSISIFILGWALPRYDECAQWGKAQLVDVLGGQSGDDVARGGIYDVYARGRGPREEATIGRVDAATEVAFWFLEAWNWSVERSGIEDTDRLGRADCEGESVLGGVREMGVVA